MSSADTTPDYPIIDAGVLHDWASVTEIAEYMPAEWREWILRPQDSFGPMVPRAYVRYSDSVTADGPSALATPLDLDRLRREVLDTGTVDRVVLAPDADSRVGAVMVHQLSRVVAMATNDWTIHEWLERDPRLYGIAVVPNQVPADAAAEIRRIGTHPQIVGVALGVNTLYRKFGHAVYNPIYEAAAELGLPLVLEIGSDAININDAALMPVGGGVPSTYGEFRAMSNHSHMSHVSSMIYQGTFVRFPGLKVLLVGGGVSWIPSFLWRLDYWHKMMHIEMPWLTELPSDYFLRHFRVATWGIESPPEPERFVKLLSAMPEPGASHLLLYMSRYPRVDGESLEALRGRLPESWHRRVFRENAEEFFRWPSEAASVADSLGSAAQTERSSHA
jgi:predicted TIM-barrel fold metal-dependent hydrolase